MFVFEPQPAQNYSDFFWKENFLSDDEIQQTLKLAGDGDWHDAEVITGTEARLNRKYRHADLCSLRPNESNSWLYEKIAWIITQCNRAKYGFDLTGILEPIALNRYGPGHHFEWHKDHGSGFVSVRKLSLVVPLSHPDEYEGGNLEFFGDDNADYELRQRGTAIIFPSFVYHRVSPVTTGVRTSLVAWAAGPPFR